MSTNAEIAMTDEEGAAMAMMETVALFELGRGLAAGKRAGVEEAVGGVEHPDGDEHRGRCGEGKMKADGRSDGDGPDGGDGGCVEREEMPEGERCVARGLLLWGA